MTDQLQPPTAPSPAPQVKGKKKWPWLVGFSMMLPVVRLLERSIADLKW